MTWTRRTSVRKVASWAKRAGRRRALASNRNVTIPLPFHPHFAVDEMLLFPDPREHLERHGLVALVIEAEGGAPPGVVADDAFEDDNRAVASGLHARG